MLVDTRVILFQQEAVREFAYGQQYAWMLVIFSVMVVYCITCPLVTPFGKSCDCA